MNHRKRGSIMRIDLRRKRGEKNQAIGAGRGDGARKSTPLSTAKVARVEYLVGQKWTSTPDDVLWRRSKLGLHPPGDSHKRLADWFAGASANPAQGVMPSSGRARQHWGQTSKPALIASPQCGHRLCAWYDRPRFLVTCFFEAINKA